MSEELHGIEKARDTAQKIADSAKIDKISDEAEDIFSPATIEHHDQITPIKHYSSIQGLEEVSTDIIPLPFYKLVQPGSTNIRISEDGQDANPGQFYQADTGSAVDELKVGMVRVKRVVKVFKGKKSVSLGVLGVNLETMTPFLMNISVTSFSNFGRMMNNLTQRKIDAVWKYPITLTSTKVETKKEIDGQLQMVKYWVMDFDIGPEAFNEEELDIMHTVLNEYAGTLDRDTLDEE